MVKRKKRIGRRQVDRRIMEILVECQPLSRGEIARETRCKTEDKTLTNALGRLKEDGVIKKIERGIDAGKYALITHISLEEATHAIAEAMENLSMYKVVTLADVSQEAMIPSSRTFDIGGGKISFEDIAFAEARKKGMKIGEKRLSVPRPF